MSELAHGDGARRVEASSGDAHHMHRHPGTRVVVKVGPGGPEESKLKALGWKLVRRVLAGRPRYAEGKASAANVRVSSFWALREEFYAEGQAVDYEAAEAGMDPRDRVQRPVDFGSRLHTRTKTI